VSCDAATVWGEESRLAAAVAVHRFCVGGSVPTPTDIGQEAL
jgi:hypothetical protein